MSRIVITGIGLTAPNGNNLKEFRRNLLQGQSGITHKEIRHMGKQAIGLCAFDEGKYQSKKMCRRGTRAASIAIYCANEAILDANLEFSLLDKERIGLYVGITEHGNVETEEAVYQIYQHDLDISFWSLHHNPRTVANNPAGEVALNLGITGPAYTIGAACAAGNMGLIQACHMLELGEVDLALGGGVSESPGTFGIYASFQNQGALAFHWDPSLASRPLDRHRNGIVISEGGALFTLERLEDARRRGGTIYGEIIGHHVNSDASDFVLPNRKRQAQCLRRALKKANLLPEDVDLINLHATGTVAGDVEECQAVAEVFGQSSRTYVNSTKGLIGHTMGAAGALELAGNLPSFTDGMIHPTQPITHMDPKCHLSNLNLVNGKKIEHKVETILNNSFGMLGINTAIIVKKFRQQFDNIQFDNIKEA